MLLLKISVLYLSMLTLQWDSGRRWQLKIKKKKEHFNIISQPVNKLFKI